jgi:histidinol-phosphatase (PHP family)
VNDEVFIDYHTHHVRCGHAIGSLEEYVQQGIELGLDQLGLSDHMPLLHVDPATYYSGMAMPMEELPRYFEECVYVRDKYKDQIDIRIGLEGDYIEGYEDQIERIVTAYPWDYVIGSVHFLGEWDISDSRQLHGWDDRKVEDVYLQYYSMVQKAAQTGFYHYLGHIDVIKRFGKVPEEDMWEVEKQTIDVIKANDLAIELNASGLRTPCAEMFPSRRILEYCYQQGVPLTVGSDAHQPARLTQNLDIAVQLLKEIGFEQLATFKAGKRTMVSI